MKKDVYKNNVSNQKKICLDKINYYNSYGDWSKIRNEFNFKNLKQCNSGTYQKRNANTLFINGPPKLQKTSKNFFITRINNKNQIFKKEKLGKDCKNSTNHRSGNIQYLNAKMFKNVLKSLKNLRKNNTKINFFAKELDFSENSNVNSDRYIFSEIKSDSEKEKRKSKLNQTSSLFSTKLSQNNTIYYNSSLDNFYNKISQKKFKTITPLSNISRTRSRSTFYSPKSYNVNIVNDIDKIFKEKNKENNEEELATKSNKGVNVKEEDRKKEINDENKLVSNSGFNSYYQIMLKNIFNKNMAKIKSGILDGVIIDYNLENNDIFLNPFYNSYGLMLEDVTEKIGFMKGSLDLVYPKIIQKKYQLKAEQRNKRINLLRSSSQKNIIKNKDDIKGDLFIVKDKNISQSVTARYPMYIKLKGKLSPHMYTLKGENRIFQKIKKQNLLMNKVN